jgi:hypothetical protein
MLSLSAVIAGWTGARAQVSPGPLAKAHHDLEGNLGCVKCHGKARGDMDRKCLACHEEIAQLISTGHGFHAREGTKNCATCHPDHGGADFQMVAWPDKTPQKFNHARTGWVLAGKHAAAACEKCHVSSHLDPAIAGKVKKKGEVAWAGLDTNCRTCHEDFHKGSLGNDCGSCHNVQGWRPANNFNHAKTAYPLTGKHAAVACAACHQAARLNLARDDKGRVKPLYKPLPHDECGVCHNDVHKGAFGTACSRCHNTAAFNKVETASFDHDKTRYPLRGGHAKLACAKCHDEKTAWGKKPAFATCGACHRDAHAGQATLAGKAVDCASCHSVESYKPSTFTVAQHAKTAYPLVGAHARAACRQCHGRTPSGNATQVAALVGTAKVWLHPTRERCIECHVDPHGGRFSPGGERAREQDCLACHTMESFRPSTMDVAAHDKVRFKLAGAHRATPCFACHKELAAAPAAATASAGTPARSLPLTMAGQTCRDCHQSPHGTQFDSRKDGDACESCHDNDQFKPAVRFDHAKVKTFALEGAHARVACVKCHPTVTTAGKKMTLYRPVPAQCESCHANDGVLKR